MKLLGLPVYEHSSIEQDESWVVRNKDSAQILQELKDKITVPCILTGDALLFRRKVINLQVAEKSS